MNACKTLAHVQHFLLAEAIICPDEPKHYDHYDLPIMLLFLQVLPKQLQQLCQTSEGPVVSGTKTLAADPLSPNSCMVELDMLFQHVPQMLNPIGILGICRPGQLLQLSIMFLKPFPNNVCSVAGRIILLKEAFALRGAPGPRQCLGKWDVST